MLVIVGRQVDGYTGKQVDEGALPVYLFTCLPVYLSSYTYRMIITPKSTDH